MIAIGLLILGGIVCVLAALFLTLLAVDMLQHPGGMGIEKVLAPIIGVVSLGLFVLAGFCMYWASRLGKRSTSQGALPEIEHSTTGLKPISPEEIEQFRSNVRRRFGLPPVATMRSLAREAAIFTLIGGLTVAVVARSLMAGLHYGSVFGLGVWIVYQLFRFALT
jgi:hypothetical protein